MLEIGDDFARQLLHRGHDVRQPGVHGAARHAVEFGRSRLLHEGHAPLFLDGPQTQRAVGAHAGQDDADAVLLLVMRQGAEEEINRQAQAARRDSIEQVQTPVQDGHVLVRRDHIDAVRLNPRAVLDLEDLHAGCALEQFGHDALVRRVQVLDNDKRHAASCRSVPQKQLQGLQSAGRGANADDGKRAFRAPRVVRWRGTVFLRTALSFFCHSREWWLPRHGGLYLRCTLRTQ